MKGHSVKSEGPENPRPHPEAKTGMVDGTNAYIQGLVAGHQMEIIRLQAGIQRPTRAPSEKRSVLGEVLVDSLGVVQEAEEAEHLAFCVVGRCTDDHRDLQALVRRITIELGKLP